jgi:hypothetical protein
VRRKRDKKKEVSIYVYSVHLWLLSLFAVSDLWFVFLTFCRPKLLRKQGLDHSINPHIEDIRLILIEVAVFMLDSEVTFFILNYVMIIYLFIHNVIFSFFCPNLHILADLTGGVKGPTKKETELHASLNSSALESVKTNKAAETVSAAG